MKRYVQSALLGVYRAIRWSGILSTTWGRSVFEWSYHQYKRLLEAGDVRALSALIKPETIVVDVGANIGFFTRFFATCVRGKGYVVAIEPEEANFSRLNQMVAVNGFSRIVETLQMVVADKGGILKLKINPGHPADHKISAEGISVKATSIDELLAERKWPQVSLIKVDVQGAEGLVLRGAVETIRRFRPALFLELDDVSLRDLNADAETVFRLLRSYGYAIHRISRGQISEPMGIEESVALCSGGKYSDFLFLHPEAGAHSARSQADQTSAPEEPRPAR